MNEYIEVIAKAHELMPDVDYIIDMYDNQFVWGSKRMLEMSEYTLDELRHTRTSDTIDTSQMAPDTYRQVTMERLAKGKGQATIFTKSKNGKSIKIVTDYLVFQLDGGYYLASKATNI